MIGHIKAVVGNDFDPLLDEWLMQIAVYDLQIEDAQIEKMTNGKYKVTAMLEGKTFKFAKDQAVKELVFEHAVPVAVYSEDAKKPKILYQFHATMNDGELPISIILDTKPGKITIDPNLMFIDRNRVDNTVNLTDLIAK